ncbi:MAG: replication factor C large subunit [Asgard group archaeon]|nr:replication factor C large subunit [Asgard group archaeon]
MLSLRFTNLSEKVVPWTEQYRPTKLNQVVGNDKAVDSLRQWFDLWSIKAKNKVAILHGPAGSGKTSSVGALAAEYGYELVEMNASDKRNKNSISHIAGSSAKEGTLTHGAKANRILLIDEVDGITGREDRGGVKSLIDVIKDASVPIICTANDAYHTKLIALKKIAKVIVYHPIEVPSIVKVLKKIAKERKLTLTDEDLLFIAENAQGDMRSAINDLEGTVLQLMSGKVTDIELLKPFRDQKKQIQEALTDLFSTNDFIAGKRAIDGLDMKYDELLLWVFENAYKHTSRESLTDVYDTIATADRFLGRIMRRQSWRLLSYFFDFVSGGVAAETDKPETEIKKYTFPQKISLYARTKFERPLINSIAANIAEKIHVSIGSARNESLYLVKQIMNSTIGSAADMAYWLDLDDNQLKKLVENPSSIPKIKRVMKAMEDDRIKMQTAMGDLQHSSFDQKGDDWTDILEEWDKQEALKEELEELKKEEEKQKKKAAKKKKATKKKAEKKTPEPEKDEEETLEEDQMSLDQFF